MRHSTVDKQHVSAGRGSKDMVLLCDANGGCHDKEYASFDSFCFVG